MPTHGDSQGRDTRADASRFGDRSDDSGPTGTLRDSSGHGQRRRPTSDYGPPQTGETFAGFTVGERIGRGAMGLVYRARDAAGRDVALKLILAHQADADGVARFVREGQAMAQIPAHPNVVRVLSAGKERGLPWLAMDFVEGTSLKQRLKHGPLPVAQARLIASRLAEALAHIHAAGVVHRDLKPANVMLRERDGEPLLTDFGLARVQGARSLTISGDVLGTPVYMSPEQILGLKHEVDAQSDIWALGIVLYEMLAGQPPFLGSNLTEMATLVTTQEPAPIRSRRGDVDAELARVLGIALSKPKLHRFPDAAAFAAALGEVPARGSESDVQLTSRTGSFASGVALPRARAKALRVGLIAALVVGAVIGLGAFIKSRLGGADIDALQGELKKLDGMASRNLPKLLDREVSAEQLESLTAQVAALRAKSEEAGAKLDLSRVEDALRRARLIVALNASDWKAAEAEAAALTDPPQQTLLRARIALARGATPEAAALEPLTQGKGEVAVAGRILLAQVVAETDPQAALALLRTVSSKHALPAKRLAELLQAIAHLDPDHVLAQRKHIPAPALRRAWRRAFAKLQEVAEPARPEHEPLTRALRILALLVEHADPQRVEAAGPAVARRCLERVRSLESELLAKVGHSARDRRAAALGAIVNLLVALGDSGLRPPWPERADLDEDSARNVYKDVTNQLLYIQRDAMTPKQIGQLLRALVQLDIPLQTTALSPTRQRDLAQMPDGPLKVYVTQRVRSVGSRSSDPSETRKRMAELVGTHRHLFGPHHQSMLLARASGWTRHSADVQLAMARKAVALDPQNQTAELSLLIALARARLHPELDPKLAELERRLDDKVLREQLEVRERLAAAHAYAYLGNGAQVERWLDTIHADKRGWLTASWVASVKQKARAILRGVQRAAKQKQE